METKKLTCPQCNDQGGMTHCDLCNHTGEVTIDPEAIIKACVASRGKNKGFLRASKPKGATPYGTSYVWRMARFYSGQDMRMPATAGWEDGIYGIIDDDDRAIMDALDRVADVVAKTRTPQGTDKGAAIVWGKVMGWI